MKYRENYPEILLNYAKENEYFAGSITGIAKIFNTNRTTIYDWMEKYPDFKKAIESIHTICNEKVENALLKSALGYNYEEKLLIKDGTGPDATVLKAQIFQKHMPANITSQKFWLTNKKGDVWKEKQEVQANGSITVVFEEGDDELL